jgi:tRNA dimethylallyltransferase
MASEKAPLLLIILGPTASGKSALAMALARALGAEILVCDSTQLYRGFDVGTAKPSAAERAEIAHHLIDVLSPKEIASAGLYRGMALKVLDDLRHRGRTPILTAGTGLYLRVLLEGLSSVPRDSAELRQRIHDAAARHRSGYLHRLLRRIDPPSAARIAPADEKKLVRAIEVCLLSKTRLSDLHKTRSGPLEGWHVLKIGLNPPRHELYARINARTDAMLAAGWAAEVRALLAAGLPENAKPFDFIGYAQVRSMLRGEATLEEARAQIQQATRNYAKRQLSWFRREAGVRWLSGFGDDRAVLDAALDLARLAEGKTAPSAGV